MSHPEDFGVMRTEAWDDLQKYLNRFEEAWKYAILHDQQPPDLYNYIPPFESQARGQVHVELVKTDLEYRWKQGQTPDLDSYIQKYKELGTNETVPVSLIFEEYRIRLMHGVQVKLPDYQKRFPIQYPELQKLVEAHPSVRPTPSLATSTPAPHSVGLRGGVLDFAAGATIEGFELLQMLDDKGGFGEVWKAREQNSGACFALKRTKSSTNSSDVQRVRESLELLKGKELKHPYLIQIHRWFEYGRKLCIVMELASGGDLKHRLVACKREGHRGIPVMELFKHFKGLAEALDYLHDVGIQHRDIKPQNILLVDGVAKLADFDLVKEMAAQRIVSHTMGGTPAYQAPEMFDSDFVNRKSDQYCFAYTYAELRLGKLPFHFATHKELRNAHQNDMPNLEALPFPEQEVLHKALAKKPQSRFETCTAFVMALREAVGYIEEWQGAQGLASPAIVDFGRGAVIKGYEVVDDKPLGEGGFGEVWKARKQSDGACFAIKRSKSGMDADDVKRVLNSLQLFKDLKNKFLLQAIEWFRYGRKLCIVMELATGSLKERLTECKRAGEAGIPVEELLDYFKGLADGLDYLHDRGIQHRDIKPENILLVDGVAKLADFDLAKQMDKGRFVTNTMGGTLAYQAPEMFDGEFVNRKSDQYCFAYAYAELRLGKLPFDYGTQKQLRVAHLQERPNLDPLPEVEQEVLIRALAKKPKERYANCLEFYNELQQAVRMPHLSPSTKPRGPVVKTAAPPRPTPPITTPTGQPVKATRSDKAAPVSADLDSIRPGTAPAMKTDVRKTAETLDQDHQPTLKPRVQEREPKTNPQMRPEAAKPFKKWSQEDEEPEPGGSKKWLVLALAALLLVAGGAAAWMWTSSPTNPAPKIVSNTNPKTDPDPNPNPKTNVKPNPTANSNANCEAERADLQSRVEVLRKDNKFDVALGAIDAFAAQKPDCAKEVEAWRAPLYVAKIDWLAGQNDFHGAFKEINHRADILGDQRDGLQDKVFEGLKQRLAASKNKPQDYAALAIAALYKDLPAPQQAPVLDWVKQAHAEMLEAAGVPVVDAVARVKDFSNAFGPAPASWICFLEIEKCLASSSGANSDKAFQQFLALAKAPPTAAWDVPLNKLTDRLLTLAARDGKVEWLLLEHEADLRGAVAAMNLTTPTKSMLLALLDSGQSARFLAAAAKAYDEKKWSDCQQALSQIKNKDSLQPEQRKKHDVLIALADARLGHNPAQASDNLMALLLAKDDAPPERVQELWNTLASVQSGKFTLDAKQLAALENAWPNVPESARPKVRDDFFALVNQYLKDADAAKRVGPLKTQFASPAKARASFDRLGVGLKIYDRASMPAPLDRQIDLVLAAATAGIKEPAERAYAQGIGKKLIDDKALFQQEDHAKTLYPLMLGYAELLDEPGGKVAVYCDLLDRVGDAGIKEMGLAEFTSEVLKKAIDLRGQVEDKDKQALARLLAFQAGLIVDNKDAAPKWPYADPPQMVHDLYGWAADLDRSNVDYAYYKVKSRAELPKVNWDELAAWCKSAVADFPQEAKSYWVDGWVKLHVARLKKADFVKGAKEPDEKMRSFISSKEALDASVKNAVAKGLDKGDSPLLAQILLDRSQVSLEMGNYYATLPFGSQPRPQAVKFMETHFGHAVEDAESALKIEKTAKQRLFLFEALGNAYEDDALYSGANQQAKYTKAKEAFEQAKKIDDKRATVRTSLGRVLVNLAGVLPEGAAKKQSYNDAEKELQAALAGAGQTLEAVEPTYFLARIYRWRDQDLDKTVKQLQKAKKLHDKLPPQAAAEPLISAIAAGYARNAVIESADLYCVLAAKQLEKIGQDSAARIKKLNELIGNNPSELESAVVVLKHKTMTRAGIKPTAQDVKELENNVAVAANDYVKMWSNLWLAFEKAALSKRGESLAQFQQGFKIAKQLMDDEGGLERLAKMRAATGYDAWTDLWEFYGYAAGLAFANGKGTAAEVQEALAWVQEAMVIAPKTSRPELEKLEKQIKGN